MNDRTWILHFSSIQIQMCIQIHAKKLFLIPVLKPQPCSTIFFQINYHFY
jgi:hypothetical protein